jgi:hypothetical protein
VEARERGLRSIASGWRELTRELALEVVALCILTSGCTYSSQFVPTQPSAITQQLVIRSLERALTQLDLTGFVGRRVTLDLFTQTANQTMIGPPRPEARRSSRSL